MSDAGTKRADGSRRPRFPSSKFLPAQQRPQLVHRLRLLSALDRGREARLTLVVGTPGAGKSSLIADWVRARSPRASAWLTCDTADADPVRLVAAIVESLRRAFVQPELGGDALQLLGRDGEVSADVVAALVEDEAWPDVTGALVIDDFHLSGPLGDRALAMLIEANRPGLQLVVASHVDPSVRLLRLRMNGELVELRDDDLRFSLDESAQLFSGLGLQLSERELRALHERSDGWVAGLQMAAISIRHSRDRFRSAAPVELTPQTVAGYFLDEVVYRQPPEMVDFMLDSSILDELSRSACTALCGDGSAALLERLYRDHLFVTCTDEVAGTYRYHQLIREVLRNELHAKYPTREATLHQTAARYLAEAGQVGLAAKHLLAAGQPEAAFQLLDERVLTEAATNPTMGSALDLAEIQPESFAGSAELLVPLGIELLSKGAFARGAQALALAEAVRVDPHEQPDLAMRLSWLSTQYLAYTGQLRESLAQGERTRRLLKRTGGTDLWASASDVFAMHCRTYLGEFAEARSLIESVATANLSAAVTDVMCRGVLSQVALAEGGLDEAEYLAAGALESSRTMGFNRHTFSFLALRTTALTALERRDIAVAGELVERGLGIADGTVPIYGFLAQLDRARVWAAGGAIEQALSSLPAARAVLRNNSSVLLAHADELEVRLRLSLGDQRGASSVTERLPDDRRSIVKAFVAIGLGDAEGASDALERVPSRGATFRSDLELRLLRASAAVLADSSRSAQLVGEALAVADEHGFVQTVLDWGPRVVDHLIENPGGPGGQPRTEHVRALLAARVEARWIAGSHSADGRLPDPLTDAELRVLQILPLRLTYIEMAARLDLSTNTVKTHLRRCYMKLGVGSRGAAVQRASALGLL